jgi:hypothetical protein
MAKPRIWGIGGVPQQAVMFLSGPEPRMMLK